MERTGGSSARLISSKFNDFYAKLMLSLLFLAYLSLLMSQNWGKLDFEVFTSNTKQLLCFTLKNILKINFLAGIGPDLVTEAVLSFCKNKNFSFDALESCDSMALLPYMKCFPCMYTEFKWFYEEENLSDVFDRINQHGSYFAHIWNRMLDTVNSSLLMARNSKTAYIELAKVYCPKVFATVDEFF